MERGNRSRRGVDAYLFPTVIGGGLGDIAEVRDAGARLHRAGFAVALFRQRGRPMPSQVERLFEGSTFRRVGVPMNDHPRAVTIAPMWGVSAAPARDEPFGRPGEWDPERRQIEAAYGSGHVLHVSLEEFARTLTSREETAERYREGGKPTAEIRRHLATTEGRREVAEFHFAYRKFRAFDRPDVLHLFATFRPSAAFAREYPEAIQTGPLWPVRASRPALGPRRKSRSWVWYASPSTSNRIAAQVELGLARADAPIELKVRTAGRSSGSRLPGSDPGDPAGPPAWDREVASAELRIVTGSRTLLEALADRAPFLYFNGVLGAGRARRRHRPEKIRSLLGAWRSEGIRSTLGADLEAFSMGRRVAGVVERAARSANFRNGFRAPWRPSGFRPPFEDAGTLLLRVVAEWSDSCGDAEELVDVWRSLAQQGDGGARRRPAPATPV